MHQLIDKKNKIFIYLLLLFILSTTSTKFAENQSSYSSKINQINIKGLSNAGKAIIFNQLNNLFYKNILLVEKQKIQKVMSKHNIIEDYNVKKIYPSTININIQPTSFVARLSSSNQLVGANGKLIVDNKNSEILPYIFGEFNSQEFLILKKNIEQTKFTFTKLKTLYFFSSKRWDILTNDGILIKLPKNNSSEILNLAYEIISSNDFKDISVIDLRINNQLIIQ